MATHEIGCPRAAFAASASASVSIGTSAQAPAPPKSQLGIVSQLIAGTRVEVLYRRPVGARSRALRRTRPVGPHLDAQRRQRRPPHALGAVEINGSTLAAGSYSIWTIPDSTSWTIIFNRTAAAFHLRYPSGQDVLRVTAVPSRGEHVETLMWEFPVVDADSASSAIAMGDDSCSAN